MKKTIIVLISVASVLTGYAQDAYFTQYNNSRLTVNPAFAGSDSAFIIAANYRLQWPNINSPYTTINFSADKYIHALRGGIGVNYVYDYETKGAFTKSRIDFNYAPHFELLHHTLVIQPGFQFSYLQNTLELW